MLFGVVLVGSYTSIFIAAPLLIYFGVGSFRASTTEEEPEPEPAAARKRA
jgi:preprotein translocase subunit SecF